MFSLGAPARARIVPMSTQLLHWTDEFSIALQGIEEQHRELVKLLNQLHSAIKEHHGSATSREILDKLDSGQATITFELLHFLKVWLMRHINEADKRFGAFFLEAGGASKWSDHVEDAMNMRTWWRKFW